MAVFFFLITTIANAVSDEVIFAVREPKGPHWYENFGHVVTDVERTAYGSGGRLCKVDVNTGKVIILIDDPQGAVRDPQVDYDGQRILFSYRKGGSPHYHLYEIGSNGQGLKQLTDGAFDDLEPSYLPDGGIVFCSSRCKRYVPCWYVQVATLHRCDGDGKNIRALSSNIEQDNTPWVLPDGRIVFISLRRGGYLRCGGQRLNPTYTMFVMDGDGGNIRQFGQHIDRIFPKLSRLRAADAHVRAPLAGRREQRQAQQIGGNDLYGCEVRANVTARGELINISSTMLARP